MSTLGKLGEHTGTAATGAHKAGTRAEGEWEGEASQAFQGWAKRQGTDGDALAEVSPTMARAYDTWADEINTVKARMEQAKQVARDGGLKLMGTHLILPPKAPTVSKPEPPKGRATAAQSEQYANDKTAYDAAMAEADRQQAVWEEVKATVEAARQKEKAAHEQFSTAMEKAKAQLDAIPQSEKWAQAGERPEHGGQALAKTADRMEANSVKASVGMLQRASEHGGAAAVNAVWTTMSPTQQANLIEGQPRVVGNANGIPSVVRDQANRAALAAQYPALVSRAQNATGEELKKVKQSKTSLEKLMDDIGPSADESDKYLLGLDDTANERRGQVIVAQGNPDHADNVMTLVPGTHSDLGNVTDYTGNNEQVLDRAHELSNGGNVAITYSDYESPNALFPDASFEGYAQHAKADLADFQDGLRVTHEGDQPSHNTLVGHSYGSTLVGVTASEHGIDSHSDDLVFLGSPGTGVDHASQLDAPSEHVWAATSENDDIHKAAASPLHDPLDWFPGTGDDHWFGKNPADPQFGGNTMPVNPNTEHMGYWDDPQTRESMARIMTGEGNAR